MRYEKNINLIGFVSWLGNFSCFAFCDYKFTNGVPHPLV